MILILEKDNWDKTFPLIRDAPEMYQMYALCASV